MKNRVLSVCLVLALLPILTLVPQAAQPADMELSPEQMPRRMAGRLEPLPYLDLGAGPAQAEAPQASASVPSWSRLTFQSYRDGGWEIYRADGDGSNQVRLTYNSVSDIQPDLNRGAARIASARYEGNNYDLYGMNADGSGQSRLTTDAAHEVNPAWSPDSLRLAYESYQTGDGDIYVMNATGGGQLRLTADAAWDGEPAWSPDGTRIAFTSYRNSVYRIWLMNADGSGQVQLSSQPYSEHPAWSPDGSLIAYDADGNGDGWLELWLMNADGTNQHQVYDPPESETDAWLGSWSPDGRYLAFTRISWIYSGGYWYWYVAYLDAWDRTTGDIVRLSSSGVDWMPHWQTTDVLPPSSEVAGLLAQSPSPIAVRWSGTDSGPAGIATYDVQVRDGPEGSWTDWLVATAQTSAAYPGVGGHTYYFRCRARDNAMNLEAWPADYDAWTAVESLPPQTAVEPLPPYVRGEVTVAWGGADPGGSGVASYDVQVRDDAGDWTDWQLGVADTEASFSGEAGHTYYFRSRGSDRAGNIEAWPPGDGDASTAFYTWALMGTLRDNRDTPVVDGVATLIPEAMAVLPSNVDGNYASYTATTSSIYTAAWSKPGYGGLPETEFDGSSDAHADMVLPPADNVVQNWGFESGSLEPEWLAEGEFLPGLTTDNRHTGQRAVALGSVTDIFEPRQDLSNSTANSAFPAVGVDDSGAVHVVWHERTVSPDGDVFYTRREPAGGWSEPVSISGSHPSDSYGLGPRLAVHSDGTVHVAWMEDHLDPRVYYICRTPDGTWSEPFEAYRGSVAGGTLRMAVSADGAVHLTWQGDPDVMYARRTPGGAWSAVQNVSDSAATSADPQLAIGPDATVHLVWSENISGNVEILYARRGEDGIWSSPRNVSNSSESSSRAVLAAIGDGSVHVTWVDYVDPDTNSIMYGHCSAAGMWTDPELVAQAYLLSPPQMGVAPDGSVHLAWTVGGYRVWYAHREADGFWRPLEEIGLGSKSALYVDSSGTLHFLLIEGYAYTDILYAWRSAGGVWSDWLNLSNTPSEYSWYPSLAFDRHDGVYIVWEDGPYGEHEILYVESAQAEQTTDSILSQELTVPQAAAAPTLSFWYQLQGIPTPDGAWFAAEVDDGGASTTVFTATPSRDWAHAWIDLAPWAGQAVTLRFLAHQTEGEPAAWATLDEVSVGSAYPDVWVSLSSLVDAASPASPAVFALHYGNRGGATATSVTLVDVLPPELEFFAADPPPTSQMPELTWALGDLPANSGPFTVVLTATVALEAPLLQMVTNTVSVETAQPELETLNNEANSSVWLGYLVRLPLILRLW